MTKTLQLKDKREYLKISCQNEPTKKAIIFALNSLSPHIAQSVDTYLRGSGFGKTDTVFKFNTENEVFLVDSVPSNKGKVFYYSVEDGVWINEYEALVQDDFYAAIKDGNVAIYRFEKDGIDELIGIIKDIDSLEKEIKALPANYAEAKKMQLELQESMKKESESVSDVEYEEVNNG